MANYTFRGDSAVDHTWSPEKAAADGERSRGEGSPNDPAQAEEADQAYAESKVKEPASRSSQARRTRHGQHASEPEAGQQPGGQGIRGTLGERFEGAMKDIRSMVLEARGMSSPGMQPMQGAPAREPMQQSPQNLGGLQQAAAREAMAALKGMGLQRVGGTNIDGARPGGERAQGAARNQEPENSNPAKKSTMAHR